MKRRCPAPQNVELFLHQWEIGFECKSVLNKLGEAEALRIVDHIELAYFKFRKQSVSLDDQSTAQVVRDLTDFCWEKLHSGVWNQIDDAWRELYAWCQILQVTLDLILDRFEEKKLLFKNLDLALVMGGPIYRFRIHSLVRALEESFDNKESGAVDLGVAMEMSGIKHMEIPSSPLSKMIEKRHSKNVSLLQFQQLMQMDCPVLLEGLMEDWPAVTDSFCLGWKKNLLRIAGHRYVPVEVGNNYTDEQWTQRLMFMVN